MAADPPRHLGELPSLHLTHDEAAALSRVLAFTTGVLSAREGEEIDPQLLRSEELREIVRELDRRTSQGHREAVGALPPEQLERLFEATYGERLDAYRARIERERGEGGHER